MIKLLLDSFFKALGKTVLAWLEARQKVEADKKAAVEEAAATTAKDTSEIADEQAKNNNVARGSAADVAARLRKQLDKTRSDQAGDNRS